MQLRRNSTYPAGCISLFSTSDLASALNR
jgi:hypothetical protein